MSMASAPLRSDGIVGLPGDRPLCLAQTLWRDGKVLEAAEAFRAILRDDPDDALARAGLQACEERLWQSFAQDIGQAQAFYHAGRFDEAIRLAEGLAALQPAAEALHNFAGATHAGARRFEAAIACYDRAIGVKPDYAEAHANRALALRELGRLDEALAACNAAIAIDPHQPGARANRGVILKELGHPDEALSDYEEAVRLQPAAAEHHYNRANMLRDLNRLDQALAGYDAALRLDPAHVATWANRGNVLQQLGRHHDALDSYATAIRLKPDHAEAFFNRGNVLQQLRRMDEALASYTMAVELDHGFAEAAGRMLFQRALMCTWPVETPGVDLASLGIATDAVSPFGLLALEDSAERQLARARNWARKACPHPAAPLPAASGKGPRIRIGYFSADFHRHATMYLMVKLFEVHDRERFELHAFSYGPDSHDEMRCRLTGSVGRFHDVRALSDGAAARLARDEGIDIAIDLKGHTQDTRSGIFAHRAAPVQINYLGYPGSMGADFIDYIIADDILIPPDRRAFYQEKIITLPGSYQVNDDARPIAALEDPRRSTFGLPEKGFVFCCFNNNFKISPGLFTIWMRLLTRVEGSVLWLLKDNIWAEANLRKEAALRGVDPDRLIFADRAPVPEHLARHRCADLFLDTFNFGAHTTASDALWSGLPVITRIGDGFAARVATSLLHAIELPELVTTTDGDYERLALVLACDPARLAAIRSKLAENRMRTSLFDTTLFARRIERAYEIAHDRASRGLAPDHFRVPSATVVTEA